MTSGAPYSFKCKQGLQGRKRQGRQIDGEKDERGAMQFQVQAGGGSREENVRGAKLTENRTRGAPCTLKYKQGLQGRKRQRRQIDGEKDEKGAMQLQVQTGGLQGRKRQGRQFDREKDERGAMQFEVQAGAPGKKTSWEPNWRRTRDAPCSFKCKQGLQGWKRQGRQIEGEKDERGAMQFQVQAGAPGKKMSGAPNWRRIGREGRHAL